MALGRKTQTFRWIKLKINLGWAEKGENTALKWRRNVMVVIMGSRGTPTTYSPSVFRISCRAAAPQSTCRNTSFGALLKYKTVHPLMYCEEE